jgi:uncharacterized membrane protein YfbV (UPF0208 family)
MLILAENCYRSTIRRRALCSRSKQLKHGCHHIVTSPSHGNMQDSAASRDKMLPCTRPKVPAFALSTQQLYSNQAAQAVIVIAIQLAQAGFALNSVATATYANGTRCFLAQFSSVMLASTSMTCCSPAPCTYLEELKQHSCCRCRRRPPHCSNISRLVVSVLPAAPILSPSTTAALGRRCKAWQIILALVASGA